MPIRRRRSSLNSLPCPFKVGDRIRPFAMFECHDYRPGESYEVVEIDPNDGTLRARDVHGEVGPWIRWRDCEKCEDIGWQWLKGQLSAEALELLSAFDGLSNLRLRPEMRHALVSAMPDLKTRIIDACVALESTRTSNP